MTQIHVNQSASQRTAGREKASERDAIIHSVALEQDIRAVFDSAPGIAAVYLFGSAAHGELRANSDIDVGVLFETAPAVTFDAQPYALEGELERRVGRPVEIITLNHAPVDLRIRVMRTGRLLIDRNRSSRIAFEVQTRNEAFDMEPILVRYRATRGAGR